MATDMEVTEVELHPDLGLVETSIEDNGKQVDEEVLQEAISLNALFSTELILDDFPDVFAEPKTLPPQRSQNHHIPLKKDAEPITIILYSSILMEHLDHLRKVLMVLRYERLFAKMSKCSFGQSQVEFLGYIITLQGVPTDPTKIDVMVNWPKPKSLKSLRGFLGLTEYYRRFVKSYGIISRPLTNILKKNAFQSNEEAELAFE
ncbi:hypothetical protein BC332_18546 [Capsicum chinense]|nr:hypothetical protein BC332_18546 [Capsicum chinense]